MKLILPLHSYTHRGKQVSSRRLVNCYPEQVPLPGKAPVVGLRSPGIVPWVTLPTSPVRGLIVHDQVLYAVSGPRLYSITSNGTVAEIGTITGSGRVHMATNGLQLVIVSEPDGWIYEEGTLTKITDPDFTSRGAADVACIDSFMLFIEPDSGRFFASAFFDASDIPFDFGVAEGAPDNLIAILVDHRQIFLFGVDSTEIWFVSGASGFPFDREQNGLIECGCAASLSPIKADNTVFWLDDKRIARRLSDLTPQRISTHAIEARWQDYAVVDDAYSVAYVHDGHTFWCLTFPTQGESWEYDIATGEWHERSSRAANGGMAQWRVSAQTWAYGFNIVGDTRSGKLGQLSANTFTEFTELQRMEATYPNVYAEGRRAFHKRLTIDFESGRGLTVGQGSDPQAMLYVSDNGGASFVALPSRSIGKIGEYRHQCSWSRLGTGDDIVYRVAVSDPVFTAIIDAQLEVEGGRL